MDEFTFVFSPSVADQTSLVNVLQQQGAKNFTVMPEKGEHGQTQLKIWTFEGEENIKNIRAALSVFFKNIAEDGNVLVNSTTAGVTKKDSWEFSGHATGLVGLSATASQLLGMADKQELTTASDHSDLDVATVEAEPLPDKISVTVFPSTGDDLLLKRLLESNEVELYTLFNEEDDDGDTVFRIDSWENSVPAIKSVKTAEGIGEEGSSVAVQWGSGRTETWSSN